MGDHALNRSKWGGSIAFQIQGVAARGYVTDSVRSAGVTRSRSLVVEDWANESDTKHPGACSGTVCGSVAGSRERHAESCALILQWCVGELLEMQEAEKIDVGSRELAHDRIEREQKSHSTASWKRRQGARPVVAAAVAVV